VWWPVDYALCLAAALQGTPDRGALWSAQGSSHYKLPPCLQLQPRLLLVLLQLMLLCSYRVSHKHMREQVHLVQARGTEQCMPAQHSAHAIHPLLSTGAACSGAAARGHGAAAHPGSTTAWARGKCFVLCGLFRPLVRTIFGRSTPCPFREAPLTAHSAPPSLRATGINTNYGVRGRGQGSGAGGWGRGQGEAVHARVHANTPIFSVPTAT